MYFILYSIFISIATSFMLPSLYRSTSRLKSLTNVNLIRSNYQLNLSMKLNYVYLYYYRTIVVVAYEYHEATVCSFDSKQAQLLLTHQWMSDR
jgi:hypothetical protein